MVNKAKDLKPGMIAWARLHHSGKHTNVYWPCMISELIKLKDRRKVGLRFYEFQEDNKFGPKFKKDLSEVECFYQDTEQHFKYKVRIMFHLFRSLCLFFVNLKIKLEYWSCI